MFAHALQPAISGVEGEIRAMMQPMFQARQPCGPAKYRDMQPEDGQGLVSLVKTLTP